MYFIVTKFQIEGFHAWEQAPECFSYLRTRHRHVFEITAINDVGHADRDKEVNNQRKLMLHYLKDKYGEPCEFGNMSCEAIAQDIAYIFGCTQVTVLEDGLCGAGYKI